MAYEIKSISYPAIKPILAIEADSLSDISGLEGMAEGSTCKVSDTTYVYDEVNGWAVAGTQGKELPAVTSDDNGDVLTVVEGAWAKAAPGGGGGSILIVNVTEESSTWTMDKTWEEVYDAFTSGPVRLNCPTYGDSSVDVRNVIVVSTDGSQFDVYFWDGTDIKAFHASGADAYPTLSL